MSKGELPHAWRGLPNRSPPFLQAQDYQALLGASPSQRSPSAPDNGDYSCLLPIKARSAPPPRPGTDQAPQPRIRKASPEQDPVLTSKASHPSPARAGPIRLFSRPSTTTSPRRAPGSLQAPITVTSGNSTVNDPNWASLHREGHWVYSDAGWTWVSDEPWGWATYHYGRWVNLDGTGWCWVPGYTWAPAWVSWRYGDGYCGWAPLPPDSFVGIDYGSPGVDISVGFHIGGDCDSYYGIGAGCYHFVPVAYLGYRSYRGHYANPHNNYAIINRHPRRTSPISMSRPMAELSTAPADLIERQHGRSFD